MKRLGVFSDHHDESANFPIGFENQGANVCFFSSVMEILFSLSSSQNYVQQSSYDNQKGVLIKGLLQDIKLSKTSVITSKYVQNLGPSNHVVSSEHDAHECLIRILVKSFPDINQS